MVIFAPVFANLLFTVGCKNVLVLGCICEGVSMVIFGLFYYLNGATTYAACSFLCRMLEGFGNGCLNSSCKFLFGSSLCQFSIKNSHECVPRAEAGKDEWHPLDFHWSWNALRADLWLYTVLSWRVLASFLLCRDLAHPHGLHLHFTDPLRSNTIIQRIKNRERIRSGCRTLHAEFWRHHRG